MSSPHHTVDRLLWLLCWAHGSSYAYLPLSLIPFLIGNSQPSIPYHLSAVSNRYAIQGTGAGKGLPGEEKGDFLYDPMPGTC
jgi:hypothetical protein